MRSSGLPSSIIFTLCKEIYFKCELVTEEINIYLEYFNTKFLENVQVQEISRKCASPSKEQIKRSSGLMYPLSSGFPKSPQKIQPLPSENLARRHSCVVSYEYMYLVSCLW